MIEECIDEDPGVCFGVAEAGSRVSHTDARRAAATLPNELYEIIPEDHRQPYDMRKLLECLLDDGHLDEFQADYAKEMITGHASHLAGSRSG